MDIIAKDAETKLSLMSFVRNGAKSFLKRKEKMENRIFSFGGGIQSTAALVLAIQGKINYKKFIFANVGNNAENPATIHYVEKVIKPLCKDNGIDFIEVEYKVDLYDFIMDDSNNDIPIPAFLLSGAPGMRNCTVRWKIKPIEKWIRKNMEGETILGIGISLDEIRRAKPSRSKLYKHEFPLLDLMLRRHDCYRIIESFGIPLPDKSSCFFCPYKRKKDWQEMKKRTPYLFKKAIKLEKKIQEKRYRTGKDEVFLTQYRKNLDLAINEDRQEKLFEECEGYCFF